MKLLYLTMDGFDTPSSCNQMAEVMINDFLESGMQVHLVESVRKRIFPSIPEKLENRKGFTYDIIERPVVDKNNFVKRYLEEMSYAFKAKKRWKKVRDCDVVFLQSCPTVIFPLALLKMFYKKPVVYNIYDVFPGQVVEGGHVKANFIFKVLRQLQKLVYKWADSIVVLSEDMKQSIIKEGAKEEKITIIPPWFDEKTAHEVPAEENRFLKKFNIPQDKFYVQFAGNIGFLLHYQTILETAKRVQNEKNIVFQIVGDGAVKEDFEKKAAEMGLDNMTFYPLQPIELVPDVYSACSISIVPYNKGVIFNGFPSKMPILLQCGRVLLSACEKDCDYYSMAERFDIGVTVEREDYDALAKAVLYLYNNPDVLSRMAQNGKRFARENYTSTANTKKFIKIFKELVK